MVLPNGTLPKHSDFYWYLRLVTSHQTFPFNRHLNLVCATEWTSAAINFWFFPRNAIPADIGSGVLESSEALGALRAVFSNDFEVDDHFKDLSIVFNTTFCGDRAGAVWANSSCAVLAPTCEKFMTKNRSAFRDVHWAINSLKIFETDEPPKLSSRCGGAVLLALP
jgi:hypothetical protein